MRRGYCRCRHMWREEGGEDMMVCGGTYEVRARRGHHRRRRMWRGEARHRRRPSGVWREVVGEDATRARGRLHCHTWRYSKAGEDDATSSSRRYQGEDVTRARPHHHMWRYG